MDQSPSWEDIGSQLVKKFPAFYRTRRFITAFTSARLLSLSWANSIQYTSHFLNIHLNIILPSMSGCAKWSLSFRFPHQNPAYDSPLTHTRYMPRPSHFLDFITWTVFGKEYRSLSSSFCPISCPFFVAWVAPMYQSRSEAYFLTVSQQDKFCGEEMLASRPNPKVEDHPLSAGRACLFNIFAATLLIGGRSSIQNLRMRHDVVTWTHLSLAVTEYSY